MHFEILVEDQSGRTALEILLPKIIGFEHTFKIHPYKGIGHLPGNMKDPQNAKNRILLENLPKLLKGYGKTFKNYPEDFRAAVILVCDLDDKSLEIFLHELNTILNNCEHRPETRFCIAIEEGEAWFMGDLKAIRKAYPEARDAVLETYENDSICGTWEKLADAVYKGGAPALIKKGWQAIGAEKTKWAKEISPHMIVENNNSPSFCYFCKKIHELTELQAY
ncbi:MAG: DUF4276 family protein [Candidatus Riflebacteria bacterium]|nr:DUF4276 family protein [Candidatus Riflebacteria bacterium]